MHLIYGDASEHFKATSLVKDVELADTPLHIGFQLIFTIVRHLLLLMLVEVGVVIFGCARLRSFH